MWASRRNSEAHHYQTVEGDRWEEVDRMAAAAAADCTADCTAGCSADCTVGCSADRTAGCSADRTADCIVAVAVAVAHSLGGLAAGSRRPPHLKRCIPRP